MSDINKVTLRGRAAANADWKDLPNTTLVTLRVGTSDDYTDRDGRKVERTDWHMVACWGKMADQARDIRKGDRVEVEGKLRTRSWDDKGTKRYITEIIAGKITRDSAERELGEEGRCIGCPSQFFNSISML
jgi:single-strand DNA-binding protein